MKTSIQKILAAFILIVSISTIMKGQTNVSGTINTNTTWLKVNSPYVLTGSVTVDPGYTLTIEPGVEVRYNGGASLTINRSNFIAKGTINDSIIFSPIANIGTTTGMLNATFLYFNGGPSANPLVPQTHKFILEYCVIEKSSNEGINVYFPSTSITQKDTLSMKYSVIRNTSKGIWGSNPSAQVFIDSCSILSNDIGIYGGGYAVTSSVFNNNNKGAECWRESSYYKCLFINNLTAIERCERATIDSCIIRKNTIGITVNLMSTIKNSIIDSNSTAGFTQDIGAKENLIEKCTIKYNTVGFKLSTYNLGSNWDVIRKNSIEYNGIGVEAFEKEWTLTCNKICNNTIYDFKLNFNGSVNIANNYWCSTDAATIASHIYDGFDNTNVGLATFTPFDVVGCYAGNGQPTGLLESAATTVDFSIYPNPASSELNIKLPESTTKATVSIYNLLGEMHYSSLITANSIIDVSSFANGIYVIEVNSETGTSRQKFIKK